MKTANIVKVINKENTTEIIVDGKRIPYITEYALSASESSNFVDLNINLKIPQQFIKVTGIDSDTERGTNEHGSTDE